MVHGQGQQPPKMVVISAHPAVVVALLAQVVLVPHSPFATLPALLLHTEQYRTQSAATDQRR